MTTTAATKDGLPAMIAYLTRVLKTPTIGAFWEELAAQARDENWSHEEYLAALLQRQVADRESKGTVMRIRTAHFPQVKTLEDFNLVGRRSSSGTSLQTSPIPHTSRSNPAPRLVGMVRSGEPGGMSTAPITVHRPSASGGRQVTAHFRGREEILGTAYSDHDLVVFLQAAGVRDPDRVLDDPRFVEWRGGRPHQWTDA